MTDDQGEERSFTANFCNRKGRYARYEEADDQARLERFSSGLFRVRFEDEWKMTQLTGQERAILLTREGEAIPCAIAGYEGGYWYLKAADFSPNEIVSVAISNVQGKKGTDTLYGDFLVVEAELPVFERTEFKAGDDLLEVEFKDDFEWREGLAIAAVAPDGSRLSGTLVEGPDGDELKVRFQGLQAGQTYRLEISGTPFHITITGKFIASDRAKVE